MDFKDPEFIKKLTANAGALIKQAKTEILDHPKFKILKLNYLQKFWLNRSNKQNLFTIYFKEELLDKLDFKCIEANLEGYINPAIQTNNYIEVNEEFNLISAERKSFRDRTESRKCLKEISENGNCVFFFGKQGVDIFIKGDSITELNVFYNTEDLERYSEKKDISQIKEVFRSYQNNKLRKQHEYSRFFVDKGTINKLPFGSNILKNKPEKFMRDHLRDFLNERMCHTFKIEIELEASKREIDIYTEVDGEFYFFEVKWLGQSINENRDKISVKYGDSRAREGVKQTLQYIEELVEVMNSNVKVGYLVIFDARDEKNEIDYQDYKNIDANLRGYMELFSVMDPLELHNEHPA
ncbi:hypothetical protein QCQ72_005996 [Bacillus cereus]|nr:hypothetical protein [Bacillus cereus]